MARQKLPQHKDDCIKCDLPSKLGVMSYLPCMNCRNKAVEECRRLESAMVEHSSVPQANELLPLVSGNVICVCPNCKKEYDSYEKAAQCCY